MTIPTLSPSEELSWLQAQRFRLRSEIAAIQRELDDLSQKVTADINALASLQQELGAVETLTSLRTKES
jgi:uncharacterized protein YlxW (UPF0749 family)